jgi:hypothetical protein
LVSQNYGIRQCNCGHECRGGIAQALAMEHGLAFWWLQASEWCPSGHKHGKKQQASVAESTLK